MFKEGERLIGLSRAIDGEVNEYRITSEKCEVEVAEVCPDGENIYVRVIKGGKRVPASEGVGEVFKVELKFFTRYAINKGR